MDVGNEEIDLRYKKCLSRTIGTADRLQQILSPGGSSCIYLSLSDKQSAK